MTEHFYKSVSVDATRYGLSSKWVGVSFDGANVTVVCERDGRDVETYDETGSRDELERLATIAERDPKSYAEQTLSERREDLENVA